MRFVDLLSWNLSLPGHASTVVHYQEGEGPATSLVTATLAKTFARDIWASGVVSVNRQFVSDGPGVWFFAVVDLEFNRSVSPLRADTLESATALRVTGLLDPEFQAVREKTEGVEERALPHPVLPDHDGHRSQGLDVLRIPQLAECQVLQHPVVRNPNSFDLRHRSIPRVNLHGRLRARLGGRCRRSKGTGRCGRTQDGGHPDRRSSPVLTNRRAPASVLWRRQHAGAHRAGRAAVRWRAAPPCSELRGAERGRSTGLVRQQ